MDMMRQAVDCEQPGATTRTLPVRQGYWRASADSTVIRQCFNEVGVPWAPAVVKKCFYNRLRARFRFIGFF